ncbi:hypothetical protein Tco_1342641 [Tanacetum coccineum]
MPAGANKAALFITISSDDDVCIDPSPEITTKTDGLGRVGNTIDAPWSSIHQSTSNSSQSGMYLLTYGFKETPFKILGNP